MEQKLYYTFIETPIGFLKLTSSTDSLISVLFSNEIGSNTEYQPQILIESVRQLDEYFKGERKTFQLKLAPSGTDFQKNVWNYVNEVAFGQTVSYLDIAKKTGSSKNTRAVGLANGKNPIPIIIPCHRIIGKNGKLTGYAGGIDKKRWLLRHEFQNTNCSNRLF